MSKVTYAVNWVLVFFAYFTLFSLGLLDNARGPYFADIITELNLTDTRASLFFAITSTMAFVSGRYVPLLVRRLKLLTVLRIGQIIMGVGFALISLSHGLITLLVTAAIFGIGFGLINVVQNLMLLAAAEGEVRRRLLSGLHGMYAFASLVSPVVAAMLFEQNIGWRAAFVGFSFVTLISFVVTFLIKVDRSKVLKTIDEGLNPNRKSYYLIGCMISLYIMSELVISTRMALYLRREYEFTASLSSMYLALFFLFLLLGRLIILFFPIRFTTLQIIEASLLSSTVCFVLGLSIHPFFLVLCGFTMSPVFGLAIEFLATRFPRYATDAIASALAMSCLFIVSMHFIMGYLTDLVGIGAAMYAGSLFVFLSWCLLRVYLRLENQN